MAATSTTTSSSPGREPGADLPGTGSARVVLANDPVFLIVPALMLLYVLDQKSPSPEESVPEPKSTP